MATTFYTDLANRLSDVRGAGLYKAEREIATPQGARVGLAGGDTAINLCANNYLGLSNHPDMVAAAHAALDQYGYGMSSVRFICGTQTPHRALEARLALFLGMEDAVVFPSCFDANAGLFETLLGDEDAIISDALNHASIIDGVRLCKARRFRYANTDMAALETHLQAAADARHRLIATDGVFSMDGTVAPLRQICDLADRHDAIVMVDDSHAVGFVGTGGRGTHEACGVMDRIDILTGTLGKALGGASGGYVAGRADLVDWLRQRSRPYLFSNAVAPAIAAASLTALDLAERGDERRQQLAANTARFRARMAENGFEILPGDHPIVPVMLRDPVLAQTMAAGLLEAGVFVTAFSFPVVPRGQDRIRTQMSAAHDFDMLDAAVDAFVRVGRANGVIG